MDPEERIKRLKLIRDSETTEEVYEEGYEPRHIRILEEEDLLRGKKDLDTLFLSPQGHQLLLQHELSNILEEFSEESTEQSQKIENSIEGLDDSIEEFKESTNDQNDKMISQSKWMNILTVAVLLATIVNVAIAFMQVTGQ